MGLAPGGDLKFELGGRCALAFGDDGASIAAVCAEAATFTRFGFTERGAAPERDAFYRLLRSRRGLVEQLARSQAAPERPEDGGLEADLAAAMADAD